MVDRTGAEAMSDFQCRGARTSVMLHEDQLQAFIEVWKQARVSGIDLPEVDDPDYESYDALLNHVLRWSRTYLIWICEQLELPGPPIEAAPKMFGTEADLAHYVSHVMEGWRDPLRSVPEKRFSDQEYVSPWGVRYCIDAMLEHAVMHPIKHRFQLEELLRER